MGQRLAEKVAVVTGGTSGIGLAIARRFAEFASASVRAPTIAATPSTSTRHPSPGGPDGRSDAGQSPLKPSCLASQQETYDVQDVFRRRRVDRDFDARHSDRQPGGFAPPGGEKLSRLSLDPPRVLTPGRAAGFGVFTVQRSLGRDPNKDVRPAVRWYRRASRSSVPTDCG